MGEECSFETKKSKKKDKINQTRNGEYENTKDFRNRIQEHCENVPMTTLMNKT